MVILGDIHCNFNRVVEICKKYPDQTVLQLGDFGVGFMPTQFIIDNSPTNFRFFVGNHDNRTEACKIPNCLGHLGEYEDIFFVSGANSIDKDRRIEGVNFWSNEELTYEQGNLCLESWQKSNKKIIVSHDAPQNFVENYLLIYDRSFTRIILQKMVDIRKPDMIIFGHHHRKYNIKHDSIRYIGLGIDDVFELSVNYI
jgi:predicted phosphodiesterase